MLRRFMGIVERIGKYDPDYHDLVPNSYNHFSGNHDVGQEAADEILRRSGKLNSISYSLAENGKREIDETKLQAYQEIVEEISAKNIFISNSGKNIRKGLERVFGKLKRMGFPVEKHKNKSIPQLLGYFNQVRRQVGML